MTLRFWPPATIVELESIPCVIQTVIIQQLSWDHSHIQYVVQWFEGEHRRERIVGHFALSCDREPIEVSSGIEEHPRAHYE